MAKYTDLSGNNQFGVHLGETGYGDNPTGNSVDVTPSDTVAIPIGRGLWVGVSGNITGRLLGSTVDQVFAVNGGMSHPLAFQFIRAAGTTATGMKVLI